MGRATVIKLLMISSSLVTLSRVLIWQHVTRVFGKYEGAALSVLFSYTTDACYLAHHRTARAPCLSRISRAKPFASVGASPISSNTVGSVGFEQGPCVSRSTDVHNYLAFLVLVCVSRACDYVRLIGVLARENASFIAAHIRQQYRCEKGRT